MENVRRTARNGWKLRAIAHLFVFLLIWPLASIPLGAVHAGEQPFTEAITFSGAVAGMTAAAIHLLPEIVALGLVVAAAGFVVFTIAQLVSRGTTHPLAIWIEPLALLLALICAISTEFPALLRHPLLSVMRGLPVIYAQFILIALAVLAGVLSRSIRAAAGHAVAVLLLATTAQSFAAAPHDVPKRKAARDSVFILGLDSLSQSDPLMPLRQSVAAVNGTWYENPVTPGLVTNSVWTSIIQHRRPSETGVFLTFQRPDWNRSPYHLVREAERRGFETWSFFSDQLTCYVGTIGGFDVDRSGPKGWLQAATSGFKDTHVFGPAFLPHLPRIPFARTPRNQSGTYGFRLSTELREFFTSGNRDARIFAAGHIDYLHQPAYPSASEMTAEEQRRVLHAKVGNVWDLSLHWQYPMLPGEPLGVFAWKMSHLQQLVTDALHESGVADPARRNRVILLSDHGNRQNVKADDFARRRYYKVVLATIGIPARDPVRPISLLDIPLLLEWPDPSRPQPGDLVVEYTNVTGAEEWGVMLQTSKLERDGEVSLDPRVTSLLGRRLLAYWPHRGATGYDRVPSVPVEVSR